MKKTPSGPLRVKSPKRARSPTSSPLPPVEVPVAELEAVAKWASTDPRRPHLRLIAFRHNEYSACDGHRLVRVPCRTHGQSFGVERAHILMAIAAHRAADHDVRTIGLLARLGDPCVEVQIGTFGAPRSIRVMIPAFDLRRRGYPSIRAMDTAIGGAATGHIEGYAFNPEFMAAIAEVHRATADEEVPVHIETWTKDKLGVLVFRNPRGIRFAVMPMRSPDK